MKTIIKRLIPWLILVVFFLPAAGIAQEELLIGTGSQDSIIFYAGKAISRIVNTKATGLSCDIETSDGSLYNLTNVIDGGLDFGIVLSDYQYHAVQGSGPFKFMDASFDRLRAVFSLHAEAFTLVVRRNSGINEFDQLPGHRINIGNPGSGQRAVMKAVMKAMGWVKKDFPLVEELNVSEQSFALCNNRIQAMVYTRGHPDASVAKSVKLCNAAVLTVNGPGIDKLIAENPYYAYTDIPGNLYVDHPDPVRTFGTVATLVTSSDLSSDTVYAVVKAVFDNINLFRRLHPAFNSLEPQTMVQSGIIAPLHDGARKYFEENNLR